MGKFSKLTTTDGPAIGIRSRESLLVVLRTDFHDHRFMGNAVLPAVEAMQVLADFLKIKNPEIDVRLCRHISFKKFLPLAPGASEINALVDYKALKDGSVVVSLMTHKRIKNATMSRLLTHATLTFGGHCHQSESVFTEQEPSIRGVSRLVPAERIYKDLVPFGPAYQNLINELAMTPDGAQADIQTTDHGIRGSLGSPFTLDAAFHGACVWGQCYLGFVPFPVGIKHRHISKPTYSGKQYRAMITPIEAASDELMVDIRIYDEKSQMCETALGVQMVDVSKGRLKPPTWITK